MVERTHRSCLTGEGFKPSKDAVVKSYGIERLGVITSYSIHYTKLYDRILPSVLRAKLLKILNARGVAQDIDDMLAWSRFLKASRCGLGQTAANPIVSTIKNFRHLYEAKIQTRKAYDTGFDLSRAVQEACEVTGRIPNI